MAALRNHRLLLMLVALLFGAGHGHQIFGQFESHHHHGWEMHSVGEVHDHEGGAHHEDEGDPEKDADHMAADHTTVAVVPAEILSLIAELHSIALAARSAEAMPEAPVAGIDYPPQLVR